jgi:hypothetical protein
MKLPSTISKILTNKYVLYLVAFLSLINVVGYMLVEDLNHLIVFVLVGVIMTYFSKNMTIILLVSLVSANLFSMCFLVEGFENGKSKEDTTGDTTTTEDHEENTDEHEEPKKKPSKKNTTKDLMDSSTVMDSSVDSVPHVPDSESFEVGRGKRNAKIDYASTITDAYSQLNELIGKDGIKSLTNDTQTLMKQQLQLADSMKAIGPLIEGITPLLSQAKGMLGGLDSNSLEGITSLAKSFSVGQPSHTS